jgi:hypothetical protein
MEGSVLSFLKAEWKVSNTEPTEPLVNCIPEVNNNNDGSLCKKNPLITVCEKCR